MAQSKSEAKFLTKGMSFAWRNFYSRTLKPQAHHFSRKERVLSRFTSWRKGALWKNHWSSPATWFEIFSKPRPEMPMHMSGARFPRPFFKETNSRALAWESNVRG